MMNTKKIKEIGKWMMVIGGTIFTAGAGTYFSARFVEKREENQIHKTKMNRIEEEERIKNLELKKVESKAKAEKDQAYAKQLETMDKEVFAKYHAEKVAVANQIVLDDDDKKAHNMYRGTDLGFGGYIISNPGIYGNVALLDVQSLYPNSAVAMNYFGEYTSHFKDILDARVSIKQGDYDTARNMLDG